MVTVGAQLAQTVSSPMAVLPIHGDQLNPAVLDIPVGARTPDVFANMHDIPPTGWLGSVGTQEV